MKNKIIIVSFSMATFSIICVLFVYLSKVNLQHLIEKNINIFLQNRLSTLTKNIAYDNNIISSKKDISVKLHGIEQMISMYTAKLNNKPVAYIFEHTYPKGYNGDILLLTAISVDKKIIGIRIISHRETPGLGDKIETVKSNWINQFSNILYNKNSWRLKQDGGQFDVISGATITSKAIVNSTNELLTYVYKNSGIIFSK